MGHTLVSYCWGGNLKYRVQNETGSLIRFTNLYAILLYILLIQKKAVLSTANFFSEELQMLPESFLLEGNCSIDI